MSTAILTSPANELRGSTSRAKDLAYRLEQGARALGAFARDLTDEEWQTTLPGDGRRVCVVVHHVASVYPVEVELAAAVAAGKPVTGLTMQDIHKMNAEHDRAHAEITKDEALELLRRNSTNAAAAIRAFSDEELDRAVPVSLYSDAVVTCQFVLEDHAVRHSTHHLAGIRRAVKR